MTTAIKEKTKKLQKKKSHAFGKDLYLLGEDKDGYYVWLEAASWDCNWYWGFGYIERYTNRKNPEMARDISSHTHWKSEIIGRHEQFNSSKQCWELSRDYIHHLNDNPKFSKTVLTEQESWKLSDLMKTFYTLKETSALFNSGNSHISSPDVSLKDEKLENHINKDLLPKIFEEIYKLLSPEE